VYGDLANVLKATLPEFKKAKPNIEVKVNNVLEHGAHHTALTTSLATGACMADVVSVDTGFLGQYLEGTGLTDLAKAPYNAMQYQKQFTAFTYPQTISDDGRMISMPADIGPGTLYYRKDILDKAGLKEADLTRSWESYVAAGKKLKAMNVFLVPNAASVADIIWRTNIPAGENLYFAKDNKTVIVDSPRFVKAFTIAKEIRDNGLDGKIGEWSAEWQKGFQEGQVATQAMGAWLVGHFQNWLAPKTTGNWRAANLPEGAYASWGGTQYAIPSACKNKEAAWELIKFLTLNRKTQVDALKVTGAFPALVAAQSDPIFNEPVAFLGGQKARQLWRTAAAKIRPLDVNPLDGFARDTLLAALNEVLDNGKDIKAALADVKAQVERRARR
jgi:multiple sugar transport system substrate-binding protein